MWVYSKFQLKTDHQFKMNRIFNDLRDVIPRTETPSQCVTFHAGIDNVTIVRNQLRNLYPINIDPGRTERFTWNFNRIRGYAKVIRNMCKAKRTYYLLAGIVFFACLLGFLVILQVIRASTPPLSMMLYTYTIPFILCIHFLF